MLLVPFAVLLTIVLAVILSTRQVLNHATQAAANGDRLAFTLRTLDTSSNLARNIGSDTIASKPSFTHGQFFLGDLYLSGPSGLTILHADGISRLSLRSGFELPVAPIDNLASGRLRETSEPQLLLATGGAGMLILEPRSGASPTIRQLLPADPEARDLTVVLPLADGDVLLVRAIAVFSSTSCGST